MTNPLYDRIPGINWSRLKDLRVSPRQFHSAPPRAETVAMRIGLAAHTLILEPHRFDEQYVVWPQARRGNAWKAFAEEHSNRCILTAAEHERAERCSDAVREHETASELLAGGVSEHGLSWTDEKTGHACKGRVDHVNGRLVEIKTTAIIDPRRFAALAVRLGYHCQLAFYFDGLRANGYDIAASPGLVTIQSEPPHDVVVYNVPDHVLGAGRAEYRRLLRLLDECEAKDEWPGIAKEPLELLLPDWAYTDDDAEPLTVGGKAMGF